MPYYLDEIAKCTYRPFTTGFYFDKPDETAQIYDANTYIKGYTYIGIVRETDDRGYARISQKNKFSLGETLEVMLPGGDNLEVRVRAMEDEDHCPVESAPHPAQTIWFDTGQELKPGWLIRRKETQ